METTPTTPTVPASIPTPEPVKSTKSIKSMLGFLVLVGVIIALGVFIYNVKQENQRLQLLTIINQAENRVLKSEIHSLERAAETKPTYEDGYKEALLRAGRPNHPGAYQDGYEAALKVVGDGSYSEGYHTAIRQFGYQPAKDVAFLVNEPTKKEQPKTINASGNNK